MSSSLPGRLRLLFLQKPTTSTAAAAAAASAVTSNGNKNLEDIVLEFKEKSSSLKFRRNPAQYFAIVRRLSRAGLFSSVYDIIDHQKRFPDIRDEKFTARLIQMYGRAKMLDHAFKLFDEMPDLNCPRTVFSINSIMSACYPSRRFDRVVEIFQEVPRKLSIKPDIITYTMAIRSFCEVGSLDSALSTFHEIEKNDMKPDVVTFSALLDGLYGGGRYIEAENLWRLMDVKKVIPDERCYNAKLLGIVMEKQPGALDLFQEMEEKGLKPNFFTYNLMIRWFVNECKLEEVKKWHAAMAEGGMFPDYVTLSMAIPLACDNNDIDFAYELLCRRSDGKNNDILRDMVQLVIDKLVEQSKVDKAKELFELYVSKSGLVLNGPSMAADQ